MNERDRKSGRLALIMQVLEGSKLRKRRCSMKVRSDMGVRFIMEVMCYMDVISLKIVENHKIVWVNPINIKKEL